MVNETVAGAFLEVVIGGGLRTDVATATGVDFNSTVVGIVAFKLQVAMLLLKGLAKEDVREDT